MEPTLTLDSDVAVGLQEEVARTGRTLQQLANDFLRHSLNRLKLQRSKPARPFTVRARPLGLKPGLNYDCAGSLIEQLEGTFHR
jgi:hypothetical protein